MTPIERAEFRKDARVALEAIEEPSEEMIRRGWVQVSGANVRLEDVMRVWCHMVKALVERK